MNQHQFSFLEQLPLQQFSDDDYYYVRCYIQNLTKQLILSTTALIIYDKVRIAFDEMFPDHEICIYQVEYKFEDWNQNDDYIQGDRNYNNYTQVPFLEILFKDQVDQKNEDALLEGSQTSLDSQNRLDQNISYSNEIEQKEHTDLIQHLARLLICESVQQFDNLTIYQNKMDQNQSNQILISFKLSQQCFMNLNHYSIKIFPNQEQASLDFQQAEILNQQNDLIPKNKEEFNKFIKVTDLNFYYITPEDLNDLKLNIPNNRPISLFLSPYFQYEYLNQLNLETYLTYNYMQTQKDENIIIIINIVGKFKLKIEIQLNNCQYCHFINNESKTHLYFKLNYPPLCSAALFDTYKIDLFDTQTEWTRVENIYLNSYFQKHKNLLEKYVILNNTIIEIQLKNIKSSCEVKFLNQLLLRLKQMKLLICNNEIQFNIVKKSTRNSQFDILQKQLDESNLSFEQKYNFICILSQNRIIDYNHLKAILNLIGKLQQNIDAQLNDQIFDAVFQQFMRFSENLSNSIRISNLNNRNFFIFQRDLKSQMSQKITLMRPILVKQVRLTPSGYIPKISLPQKPKLLIREFKNQNFIKLSLRDEDGKLIKQYKINFGQFFNVKLKEGFVIFGEKFKLLGWNNKELKQNILWMNKVSDNQLNNFLQSNFEQDFPILEQLTENKSQFKNFFIDGQIIQFKQLNIIDINKQINQNISNFGQISRNLICKIREILNNKEVSVVQIVLNGIQYVLLLNNDLEDNTIQLNSQQKQLSYCNDVISVTNYNKFRGAYLNREIIRILNQMGISDDVFIQLLNWHLEQISISKKIRCISLDLNSELCGLKSIIDLINLMKSNNLNEQNCWFIKKVQEKLKKVEIQQIYKKYNILVEKAERLFGVVDQQGILKEGEVICVRKINDKLSYLEGQLIVVEDCIQSKQMILKVIGLSSKEVLRRFGDKKVYDEYINCIIFSNKQYINTPFCTNTYFVSWDKRLIPRIQRVNNQNIVLEDFDFWKFEQEDIIDYLSDCLNNQISKDVECNHIGQHQELESHENIFETLDQIMMVKMQQHQVNDQNKVNIDERFIYRFYWMKDENNYKQYVEQCLGQNHIVQALKCLNHIVDTFNGWIKLYDIKDEYEIYSGYFESKNDDENLESFQELMILYLGQLKMELDNILSQMKDERQIQIWILHFLIIYLPNEINIRNEQLERIVICIKNQVQKFDECKFLCSRLATKSQQWFKGCSWFFFGKEILDFEQSSKNE